MTPYRPIFKNCIFGCIIILFAALFINPATSLAGSIPEDLLHDEECQVYFGEVKSVDGEGITIIQVQNIKGSFTADSEIAYPDYIFTEAPEPGKVYLCGYFDENNPLNIWEVDCCDTSSLKISNTDAMSKRMQEYLNEGLFEEAEAERLANLEARAAKIKKREIAEKEAAAEADKNIGKDSNATAVIGGADGPTAVFLAGKLGTGFFAAVAAGILLIAAVVAILLKNSNSSN